MNTPISQKLASSFTPRSNRTRQVIYTITALVTIALGLGAGWMAGNANPNARLQPIMLLGAAAGCILLLVWYNLGRFEHGVMLMALSGGTLNFFTIGTGTESKLVLSLLFAILLMVIWIVQSLVTQTPLLRPSLINTPILLFMAVNVVSWVWFFVMKDELLTPWSSRFYVTQLGALAVNLLVPALALMVTSTIREVKWFRRLVAIVLCIAALNAATKIFNLPTNILLDNGSKGLFVMWGGVFAYSQLLVNKELSLGRKLLMLLILAGILYYYVVRTSIWLSGWLPLFFAIAVVTFFYSRKLFVLLLIGALVVIALRFDVIYARVVDDNVSEGGLSRLDIWRMSLEHVANHPLLGMGPAGYAAYNMYYHPIDARSTHNNYFDVLAQTGAIGFLCFVWLFVRFVRAGLGARQVLAGKRNFEEMFALATLGGCFGAIVGMALGDWVLPFAYNQTIAGFDNAQYTWLFLGCMVSLYLSTRRLDITNKRVYVG
ncbi:MAG: O-antigen ligase family protein [Anaerolineae bacterium]|nr:O-antigen ligase family protein [Anaerolineae bacterium]